MRNNKLLAALLALSCIAVMSACGKSGSSLEESADSQTKMEEEADPGEAEQDIPGEEEAEEANEITQEFEFYSDDENVYYLNIPETIQSEGKEYEATVSVSYETLGTRNVVEQVVDLDVEELEDIEGTFTYVSDSGKTYELSNEQTYIVEEGMVTIPITYTKTYADQVGKPSVPSRVAIAYYDKTTETNTTATGTLTSLYESVAGHWASGLQVDGVFQSPSEESNVYALSGAENITVSRDAATPEWDGYQEDVLNSLGLDKNYYKITSAEWSGEQYTSGGYVYRNCIFNGEAYVANYTAVYEGSYEAPGYVTKVFYRTDADEVDAAEEDITTVYHIKAIVTYRLVASN